MNDLIIENSDKFELQAETTNKLVALETQIKRLTDLRNEVRDAIINEMEYKGILKLENDELAITYIAGGERETFDTSKFKEEHRGIYNLYVKTSQVKPTVRIRVKGA